MEQHIIILYFILNIYIILLKMKSQGIFLIYKDQLVGQNDIFDMMSQTSKVEKLCVCEPSFHRKATRKPKSVSSHPPRRTFEKHSQNPNFPTQQESPFPSYILRHISDLEFYLGLKDQSILLKQTLLRAYFIQGPWFLAFSSCILLCVENWNVIITTIKYHWGKLREQGTVLVTVLGKGHKFLPRDRERFLQGEREGGAGNAESDNENIGKSCQKNSL